MNVELFFLKKRCPSCGTDNVAALYEQTYSHEKGNWYAGCCGKLCLSCGWSEETEGRMAFPFYTGKYCTPYNVELDSGEWDYQAANLVRKMKNCDGNMDVAAALRAMKQKRRNSASGGSTQNSRKPGSQTSNIRTGISYQPDPQAAARRQAEEQAKRQAEQQAKARQNLKTAENLVNQGRLCLQRGDIAGAYNSLKKASDLSPTWEGNALLAETCARAGNASAHADSIIKLLSDYFDAYTTGQHCTAPSADQYLWRARAYLNKGDKMRACDDYYRAGDIYYLQEDYSRADQLYTEGRDQTGYYSSATPDGAFRTAFSRSRSGNSLTREDHETCAAYYREAVKQGQQKLYAWGNLSMHLRNLGKYDEAVQAAENAIDQGLDKEYVYNNLFYAQRDNEEWDEAESTLDTMMYKGYDHLSKRNELYDLWLQDLLHCGFESDMMDLIERLEFENYSIEPWLKGACLIKNFEYDDEMREERMPEAVSLLKEQLIRNPDHLDALFTLLTEDGAEYEERLAYGKHYLDLVKSSDTSPYHYGEKWVTLAEMYVENMQALVDCQIRETERQKAQAEAERRAREEAEREAQELADRLAREETEREARELAERLAREEAEREARELADRLAREEAEREARELADRLAREEAEREARELAERLAREEEDLLLLMIL